MVVVIFVGDGSEESQSNYLPIMSPSLALSIRIGFALDGFQEFAVIRGANALLGIRAFQRLPHRRHDARIDRLSEFAPMLEISADHVFAERVLFVSQRILG